MTALSFQESDYGMAGDDDVVVGAPGFGGTEAEVAAATTMATPAAHPQFRGWCLTEQGEQHLGVVQPVSLHHHDEYGHHRRYARPRPVPFPADWLRESLAPRAPSTAVTVMSYNILAARYMSTDFYPHCPIHALAEDYRLRCVLAEVAQADPDIVVFQELSVGAFASIQFGDVLRQVHSYDGFHVPVTPLPKHRSSGSSSDVRSSTDSTAVRPEYEGVGIFFKRDRFMCIEQLPIRFNQIAEADRSMPAAEKAAVLTSSHNVALILALRDRFATPGAPSAYVVGGIHAFYDASKPECQVWQVAALARRMEEVKSMLDDEAAMAAGNGSPTTSGPTSPSPLASTTATIIGGDFNAELHSCSLQYLLSGSTVACPPASEFACTRSMPSHSLGRLRSAYGDFLNRFDPNAFTFVEKESLVAGIDHLLFDDEVLACVAVSLVGSLESASHAQGSGEDPARYATQQPLLNGSCDAGEMALRHDGGRRYDQLPPSDATTATTTFHPIPDVSSPSDHYPVCACFVPRAAAQRR